MEVDVFTGLFSRQQSQILKLQLFRAVHDGSGVKAALRSRHVVFDRYSGHSRQTNHDITIRKDPILMCQYAP